MPVDHPPPTTCPALPAHAIDPDHIANQPPLRNGKLLGVSTNALGKSLVPDSVD